MQKFIETTKKYGLVTALDCVTFQVESGEVTGLIGANGAGKTTAIKLATGFLSPDSGEVRQNGTKCSEKARSHRGIAYIPDEPVYYEFMTVSEHLQFVSAMYPHGEYAVSDIITRFSLAATKYPQQEKWVDSLANLLILVVTVAAQILAKVVNLR